MRVLLLGGTGFIGSVATQSLRDAGHDVVTTSRSSLADVVIDMSEDDDLARHLDSTGYDAVVNLLGSGLSSGTADVEQMRYVNSELPARLLQLLAALPKPPHLVHAASSTERIAGQTVDESEYSRTKHHGTVGLSEVARRIGAPTTVLRVHNSYGPNQPALRFVAAITDQLRNGGEVFLNYPNRVRDFVLVDDVAACITHAVENPHDALVMAEVGTGFGLSLRQAALTIAEALGQPARLVGATEDPPPDPNPVTVCPVPFGSFGLCTTDFPAGIRRTLET